MILSHSNADFERIFSAMICAKNKLQNSIKTDLLNAIGLLVIRLGLILKKQHCMSYKLSDSVVKKIVTAEAYKNHSEATVATPSTSTEVSFFNI